jgi:hypothetical protein
MTTAALRLTMDKNGYRAQQQVELADAEFQVSGAQAGVCTATPSRHGRADR